MFPKEELANSFKKCAPPDFSARDEPHSVLSKLPLPIYMTTNYDDFMIRALKAQGREGERARQPGGLSAVAIFVRGRPQQRRIGERLLDAWRQDVLIGG